MTHYTETINVVSQTGGQSLNLLNFKGQSVPQIYSMQKVADLFFGNYSFFKFLISSKLTTLIPIRCYCLSFVKTCRQFIFDQGNELFVSGNNKKTV